MALIYSSMSINENPEIHNLVVCTNVFVRKDGKYLLLKRSPKKVFAPNIVHPIGGKVHLDEDPFMAARREVSEEAGIAVKNLRLEAVILEIMPHKQTPCNWLIFHFSADYESGTVTNTEEGKLLLLSAEELLSQKLFPSVRQIIRHILNENDGTVFARFEYNLNGTINEQTKIVNICSR